MHSHILITGCSGGGKSTLLEALAKRGHSVVPEPGLRIVNEERERCGSALPWVDMRAFLQRAVEVAKADLTRMAQSSLPVFHDRGLLDAAVGLEHLDEVPLRETLGSPFPYDPRVLVAPPWQACFKQTPERRHDYAAAIAEYERIRVAMKRLDLVEVTLPLVDVEARADFVEFTLGVAH